MKPATAASAVDVIHIEVQSSLVKLKFFRSGILDIESDGQVSLGDALTKISLNGCLVRDRNVDVKNVTELVGLQGTANNDAGWSVIGDVYALIRGWLETNRSLNSCR